MDESQVKRSVESQKRKNKSGHPDSVARKKESLGEDSKGLHVSPPISLALAKQLYQQGQILKSLDALRLADAFAANKLLVDMVANRMARIHFEALRPFEEYQRSISGIIKAISIAERIQPIVDEMACLGEYSRGLHLSSVIWAANLNVTLGAIGDLHLADSHPQLTERLIDPYVAYEEFVESTYERLETTPSQDGAAALTGSLILAQDQLTSATNITLEVLASPEDADVPGPTMPLNALQLQQEELLASTVPADAERSNLELLSPAAGTSALSRQMLSLVADCNERAQISGRGPIFKPTTRMLKTFAQLPWVVAHDEDTFGQYIDGLFWTLYEGAGDDKLRFLDDELLSDKDCSAVFHIKYLRNKWLRHDPDHGSDAKIRKTWADAQEVLQALGFSTLPRKSEDYQRLQQRVLRECIVFLERLLNALEGRPSES